MSAAGFRKQLAVIGVRLDSPSLSTRTCCAMPAARQRPARWQSGLCAGYHRPQIVIAGGDTGYHWHRSYRLSYRRPIGGYCTGPCRWNRYRSARQLDRRFNVNLGTAGWFPNN